MNSSGFGSLFMILTLSAAVGCQRADTGKATATPQAAVPASAAPVAPPRAASPVTAPAVSKAAAPSPPSTIGASSAAASYQSGRTPILRAVRTGKQPGADRLVFEFDTPGLPAWHVEYIDRPVRDCGSGDALPVAGDAWLQIRFTGAQAHTEKGESSSGPRRRPLAQSIARELVRTCDFEGEVTWVVGLARPNPYTPRVMSDPSRLVIDISH